MSLEDNDDTPAERDITAGYDALDAFTRDWFGNERSPRSLLNLTRKPQATFLKVTTALGEEPKLLERLQSIEQEHEATLHMLWTLAPQAPGITQSAILMFFSPELDAVVNTVVIDYDALRKVSLS
jgi:hypothetical protein